MPNRWVLDINDNQGNNPWLAGEWRQSLVRLMDRIRYLVSGSNTTSNTVQVRNATAAASGTITVSASLAAGTVIDVNGVEFIAVNTNQQQSANEFDMSSGVANTIATNLAACINGSTNLAISGVVTAAAATNVVTVTAVMSGQASSSVVLRMKGVMANATITVSGGAAADTAVINGVTFTAVSSAPSTNQYLVGGSDAATAANLAAAINGTASALVNQHVVARASGASGNVVTVHAIYGSISGNCITLTASGHNTASSARLVNGTEASDNGAQASGQVTIASGSGTETITINGVAVTATWTSSDTATAATLATNINGSTNALIQGLVFATSAAGVVTITSRMGGPMGNAITLAASGTGCTVTSAWAGGAVPSTVQLATWDPSLGGAHATGGSDTVIGPWSL